MTIHILEGDPGVSDSLLVLLANLGHQVVSYRDALGFFRSGPPAPGDCVIIDLALPVTGGVAVIRWLQRLIDPPRIVPISGEPQAAIEAQLHGLLLTPVLRKPLSERDILARLAD